MLCRYSNLPGVEHYGYSPPDEGSVRETVFVIFVVRFPPNCTLPLKVIFAFITLNYVLRLHNGAETI
jgi:hypothetical protein